MTDFTTMRYPSMEEVTGIKVKPGETFEVGEMFGIPFIAGPIRLESRSEGDKIVCEIRQQICIGGARGKG